MGNNGNSVGPVTIVEVGADHGDVDSLKERNQLGGLARRRLNPYFCAAWVLVSLMTVWGLLWMLGFSRGGMPQRYADYISVDPFTGLPFAEGPGFGASTLENFVGVGPGALLLGISGAIALLIVHGAQWSRRRASRCD